MNLIAMTFFLLAAYVLVESGRDLVMGVEAEGSVAGIPVTATALVVMPLLARAKRQVGKRLGNPILVAEATENALCALLSGATRTEHRAVLLMSLLEARFIQE